MPASGEATGRHAAVRGRRVSLCRLRSARYAVVGTPVGDSDCWGAVLAASPASMAL
jgi:hypothetical protein